MPDPTMRALRYFLTAVDARSITAAAEQLHVVPSAVLAAVNQVEDSFGLTLTTRQRSKGIEPTATGLLVLPRIRDLLDEYKALLTDADDMRTQLTGTLRIGYYAPVAPAFLPLVARRLRDAGARIEVEYTACDNSAARVGLTSGQFDVIVCLDEGPTARVDYQTLVEVFAYVLVPEDDPLAMRSSVSIGDLKDRDLVLLDLPGVSEYYRRALQQAGINPDVVATATTVEMVRSLVGAGVGCSLLHMRPATDITYAGDRVVAVPIRPGVEPLRIVTGQLSGKPRRVVQAFVDELHTHFSGDTTNDLLVT